MALFLSQRDVESVLTMKDAMVAVEEGFRQFALGRVRMPQRTAVPVERHEGLLLTMPAHVGGESEALGVKVVTVYPGNISKHNLPTILATITLHDPTTGLLLSVMDGTFITAMRTGAASGVATKHLARRDSRTVGIFGAGVQARTQLIAMTEVRKVELAKAYDVNAASSRKFSEEMAKRLGIDVISVSSPEEAVKGSDIIITATTSKTPVLKGEWVEAGVHVNGIGSHAPDAREADGELVRRAKVVVDSREAALREAGDVLIPIREGIVSADHIYAELGEVIVGKRAGRTSDEEITFFKSVGLALQDMPTAEIVYRRALEKGLGTQVVL